MFQKEPMAKLFMLLLGCKPPGRNVEQHDVFFGIGNSVRDLIPGVQAFWPETKDDLHLDAWRQVTKVDGYSVKVAEPAEKMGEPVVKLEEPAVKVVGPDVKLPEPDVKNFESDVITSAVQLFFFNLGGYKPGEFDEFHYKMLVVAASLDEAKNKAKKTTFFKHASVEPSANYLNATAHIDDKFGIDIDDAYNLKDILPPEFKKKYYLTISSQDNCSNKDELHLGYFRLIDL